MAAQMIAQSSGAVNFIVFRCLNCNTWQLCTPLARFEWLLAFTWAVWEAHTIAKLGFVWIWFEFELRFWFWLCAFAFRLRFVGDLTANSLHPQLLWQSPFGLLVCHLRHFCTWNAIAMDWAQANRGVAPSLRLPAPCLPNDLFEHARSPAPQKRRPHSRAGN